MPGITKKAASRIGATVRKVSREPRKLYETGQKIFPAVESAIPFRLFTTLSDNFKPIARAEGETAPATYNAHEIGKPNKKVLLVGNHFIGFSVVGATVPAVQLQGGWWAIGQGLLQSQAKLTADMGITGVASVDLYPYGNGYVNKVNTDPVTAIATTGQFQGLKSGHKVAVQWARLNNAAWSISSIESLFASGVYGGTISSGGASYPVQESAGRDIWPGAAVYCVYVGGVYKVLSAGCS